MTSAMKFVLAASTILAIPAVSMTAAGAAEPTSADIGVSVNVVDDCKIAASNIDFGNYSAVTGEALSGTGNVTVTCNADTEYTIELDAGKHDDNGRHMSDGTTNTIAYELYQNAGHTVRWGEDSDAVEGTYGSEGPAGKTIDVFGQIPAGQYVPSGDYSDSVVATVIYDDSSAPGNPPQEEP